MAVLYNTDILYIRLHSKEQTSYIVSPATDAADVVADAATDAATDAADAPAILQTTTAFL